MKYILTLFILVIFPLVFLPSSTYAANVSFNLDDSHFIPKLVNSFNESWIGITPISFSYNKMAFDKTGTNLIRFPGGTVGNFYDWETFAPNWQVAEEILGAHNKDYQFQKKSFETLVRNLNPIDFINKAHEYGQEVIVQLNLYINTPAQTAAALRKIKNAGIDIKYFELGNEMYAYMSLNEYLQKAQAAAVKIKEYYPNAQIGIVANQRVLWSGGDSRWGNEAPPNADWFDAIIVHPYLNSQPEPNMSTSLTNPEHQEYIFSSVNEKLARLVDLVKAQYPNKKIWTTEWNTLSGPEQENPFMTNTYSSSVYTYYFLLNLLKYPQITIANRHFLWGKSESPINALLQVKNNIYETYYSQDRNPPDNAFSFEQFFVKTPPYWPFAWIGEAFSRHSKFAVIDNPGYAAAYFFKPSQAQTGSIAIINKKPVSQSFYFENIDPNTPYSAIVLAEDWLAPNSEENQMQPQTRPLENKTLRIGPFAIAYITPTEVAPLLADLNQDNKVDIYDYNLLVTDFGKAGSPGFIPADIIKDGKVDIFDYNILVGNFGR
ncbi:MAG: hypothetical protein AB1721_01040 [Patescibacteria group bacterium]